MEIKDIYELFRASTGVTTDSRNVKKGQLYIALKGARFNGNLFAAQAIQAGAKYAIVDEAEYCSDQCILVSDGLECLQQLANYHRKTFDIPVIAITGSNGKTTSKELISCVLDSSYTCHFTKGNFNNHIGVPLTLLEMPRVAEVAVIEMGANHVGEIAALCEIAAPTHGLITNIGKAHLEGFGGEEGVKKGKSELYKYLADHNGVAFVNLDAKHLENLSQACKYRILYKEDRAYNDPVVHQVRRLEKEEGFIVVAFASREKKEIRVASQLMGDYNFNNIMTAIVIGKYFRVPAMAIQSEIQNYLPSNNRSQILEKGSNTYFLDAYNANPTSMEASLNNFASLKTSKDKVLILGEMKELGDYAIEEHQKLVKLIETLGFKEVYLIGASFNPIEHTYATFESVDALKGWQESNPFNDKYVLVKGSRSNSLEQIVN